MKSKEEISIPETTITLEQYYANARQFIAEFLLRATKDYCETCSKSSRGAIIEELRSERVVKMTDKRSLIVAEQLELHPNEIRERVRRDSEEE